ncbi:TPA: stage 0 sporulation protein [Candidatus Galligastranaerophilus gallistercoris]|nr:stage 0 sporulation protein [Candidatus Galligastranaerophilus gallistercoris]
MKFAVRLIKNTFHPLKVQDDVNLKQDQLIIVRTEKGEEVHKVIVVNEEISKHWQKYKPEALSVVRVMTDEDIEKYKEQKELEIKALLKCREFAGKRKLVMNLTKAVYTFDRKKITFYYTAPERVDFRELLKDLTSEFKRVRIDLRHIGVRDETALLQGQGICGQNYCCCSFLKNFDFVSTKLAKDQNIPLTPGKITGACGRLLCCLNYEYSNYIEIAKMLPPVGSGIMTPDGVAKVASICFLKQKVSAKLEDGKIKEYSKDEIEMLDQEVNIEIEQNVNPLNYSEPEENIDIKSLDNDKNSTTGNI